MTEEEIRAIVHALSDNLEEHRAEGAERWRELRQELNAKDSRLRYVENSMVTTAMLASLVDRVRELEVKLAGIGGGVKLISIMVPTMIAIGNIIVVLVLKFAH